MTTSTAVAPSTTTPPWDRLGYFRMTDVHYQDGCIAALFQDGGRATVDAARLLPPETEGAAWDAMTWDTHEITVPSAGEPAVIPSSRLRILTDSAYAAHFAALAAREARTIGRRIAALRRARGLTSKDVATRAGITPRSLSRIEHGDHDVVFSTLAPILAAMGCTFADLVPHLPLRPTSKPAQPA